MAKPMSRKDRFREWVSDNLRYMLLILAILVVVGLILLVVHLVSSNSDQEGAGGNAQVTATPTPAGESGQEDGQQSAGEPGQEFAAENNAQVSAVATTYFTALASKDIGTIKEAVDTLPAEDEAQITAEDQVESYNDIITYTLDGPTEGTYVAFVSYNCKYKEIDTQLPMLMELYMYTNEEGNLVLASDVESDTQIAEAMSSALEREEVKALVGNVQASYEQALESDADLKAYVESLQ